MIQIAICDDDMTITSQIEEYIRQIETEQHIQVQSRIFFDGKSFMQSVESGEVSDEGLGCCKEIKRNGNIVFNYLYFQL